MDAPIALPPTASPVDWPEYLANYQVLVQHIRGQLEGLSTAEKGMRFARLVQRLLPQTDFGNGFMFPEMSPTASCDEGVDLTAEARDGSRVLHIQSKLWLDRAEDLDSTLSKFEAYSAKHHGEGNAEPQRRLAFDDPSARFLVVTLSSLHNVAQRYRSKHYSSRRFYDRLVESDRYAQIDGPEILALLRGAYLKLGELPRELNVELPQEPLHKDNVYLGMISSRTLKRLYQEFGDALFFENVRDFIDPGKARERVGRTTPNLEIIRTVTKEPNALLARNNGIVFRAERIELIGNTTLRLTRGSIVNGCQTTMCIVLHAEDECYVPVKLVQTDIAWDDAKAANYQNSVDNIDLELARHLRPQIVKRAANVSGVRLDEGKESAFQIVDAVYAQRVAYQETRLIYIGLFSRQPNNIYASNYTDINGDLISRFYEGDRYGSDVFEVLFGLQWACQSSLEDAQQTFSGTEYRATFDRYYREDTPAYRCFVGILAACGAVKMNVADRHSNVDEEFLRMKTLLAAISQLLHTDLSRFRLYYRLALKTWMTLMMDAATDDTDLRQNMNLQSRKADFNMLYKKLCLEADVADAISRP